MRPLTLALILAPALLAQPPAILIRNARVVSGTGAPAQIESVLIQGNRIAAVAPSLDAPAGARLIDASGQTLIPGLFDLHTHLRASAAPSTPLAADWGKDLAAYLAAGVTSIDDFSSYPELFEPIRRLIRSGALPAPRLHLAVRISPPAGHGTEGGQGAAFTFLAATPQQARAALQSALPYHPDLVKVFTDGWRYGASPALMSMNEETIAAIVSTAHAAGIKVVTHTVGLDNAKITVRAGADSLVHGVQDREIDPELLSLIQAHHTGYVSTLAVYEPRNRAAPLPSMEGLLEPALRALLNPQSPTLALSPERAARWTNLLHNNRNLFDAGVLVGSGTDAGMPGVFHGWAALHELELQTESGLTPLQAITVATHNSAAILGLASELGTVEPGKLADLVLIDGQPDQHIQDIYKTARVFLDGREFDPAALRASLQSPQMTPLPVHPVPALVDDFEHDRTNLDTLPLEQYDPGIDRSTMQFTRIWRAPSDHALIIQAEMGPKPRNFVQLQFPLTPGALELADLSAFSALSFDARGDGDYTLKFDTYAVRSAGPFQASFSAGPAWQTLRIPFSALTRSAPEPQWTARDVRQIVFEISGPAAAKRWLELDNIRFQ